MAKHCIGIDPGLHGAIAYLSDTGELSIWDMPILLIERGGKQKGAVDAVAFGDIIYDLSGRAFVEQVGAMPGQGVSSMFSFGKSAGIVIGGLAALHIPTQEIPPAKWKATLKVPKGKDAARFRASQLMPQHAGLWPLVKHDGRAEAAMIAYYGVHYG